TTGSLTHGRRVGDGSQAGAVWGRQGNAGHFEALAAAQRGGVPRLATPEGCAERQRCRPGGAAAGSLLRADHAGRGGTAAGWRPSFLRTEVLRVAIAGSSRLPMDFVSPGPRGVAVRGA